MSTAGVLEIQIIAGIARLSDDMRRAERVVGDSTGKMGKSVLGLQNVFNKLGMGLSIGLMIDQARRMTDSYTKVTAQLRIATSTQAEYAKGMEDVRRISTSAQAGIESTTMLYTRLTNSLKQHGATQQDIGRITESVSLGLKAYGATTAEAASAMLQLSQAFGSGRLGGEEFRAVSEAMPNMMQALADAMRVPKSALRDLSMQGKITSEVMMKAWNDPALIAGLQKQAEMTRTITGEVTVFRNNMTMLVGAFMNASGSTKGITAAISSLSDSVLFLTKHLDAVVSLATTMAVLFAGKWLLAQLMAIKVSIAHSEALVMNAASTKAYAAVKTEAAAAELLASRIQKQANIEALLATEAQLVANVAAATTTEARAAAELKLAGVTNIMTTAIAEATVMDKAYTLQKAAGAAASQARAAAEIGALAKVGNFVKSMVGGTLGLIGLALWGAYELADYLGWIDKVFNAAESRIKGLQVIAGENAIFAEAVKRADDAIARAEVAKAQIEEAAKLGVKISKEATTAELIAATDEAIRQTLNSVGTLGSVADLSLGKTIARLREIRKQLKDPIVSGGMFGVFTPSKEWAAIAEKGFTDIQKKAAETLKIQQQYEIEMDRLQKTKGLSEKQYADASKALMLEKFAAIDALDKKEKESIKQDKQKFDLMDAHVKAYLKLVADESEAQQKLSEQLGQDFARDLEGLNAKIAATELETAKIGLTKEAVDLLMAAREADTIAGLTGQRDLAKGNDQEVARLNLLIEAHEKLRDAKTGQAAKQAEQDLIDAGIKAREEADAEELKAAEAKWKMIDGFVHDAFDNILDKGRDVFKEVGNAAKKYVLDMLYKMSVQKWLINIGFVGGTTAAGSAMAGGMSAASSLGSFGTSIMGASSAFMSGISTSMSMGIIEGFKAGTSLLTSGLTGGISGGLGMMMPALGLGIAALSVLKGLEGGETRTGGLYGESGQFLLGPSGGQIAGDTITKSIQDTNTNINLLLGKFGSAATLTGFAGYLESSTGGRGGAYAAGTIGDQRLVANVTGGGENIWGQTLTEGQAAQQFADDLARLTLMALQAASDIPSYLQTVFDSIDPMTASPQLINDTIAFADQLMALHTSLTETRTPLEIMTQQMTDGFAQLGTSADTFKTDFVAAIESGTITPDTFQSWITLGTNIDAVTIATNDAAAAAKEMADAALNASLQMIQSSANYASAVAEFQGAGDITKAEMGMSTAVASLNTVVADSLGWIFTNAYEAATLSPEQIAAINALPNANEVMGYVTALVQAGTAYNSAVADAAAATEAAVPSIYDGVIAIDDYTTAVLDAIALQTEQLSLLAQIYELTNNELGKDAVLQQQRLLALEELNKQDPSGHLERLTKNLWYLQDAAAEAEAALQLSNDSLALQSQLYELTGDTVAAAAVLEQQRAAVIADLMKQDPTGELAAWQMQIDSWTDSVTAATAATADTDAAFAALQRAIDAETKLIEDTYSAAYKAMQDQADISAESWQAQIDTAREGADKIRSVYDSLKSTLEELTAPTYAQAQATLAAALAYSTAGGSLVDYVGLDAALQAVKNQDSAQYTSAIDMARDTAITKNILTGLTTNAGSQLTVADLTLKAIEDGAEISAAGFEDALKALTDQRDLDIAGLDAQLELAQSQLDILNGIDNSIMSVAAAISLLASAMGAQTAADPYAKGKLVTTSGFNATKYLAANPDVASLWEGPALQHFQMFGKAEGRTYATGSNYIPYDQIAQIHAGEEITPRPYVDLQRSAREETNALLTRLVASNDEMKKELKAAKIELADIKTTNRRMMQTNEDWDINGTPAVRA